MRPVNRGARERLAAVLARNAPVRGPELAETLGVSVPTLHRMLREVGDRIVASGKARRSRYALRRPLRGESADLPLYAVDEAGRAQPFARLAPVHPRGTWMLLPPVVWPVPEASRDGWWQGFPYPLYDMRPQGYLGRQFARIEHRRLGVPENPEEWSDDDILHALSHAGADVSGNLILGDPACEAFLERKRTSPEPLSERGLAQAYAGLAEQAIASGVAGSSAAGEFPKFPALRDRAGGGTPHVLVKFSGADGSSTVVRWSDLLVCEHLALECAAALPGVAAARSRILVHGARTFLEVERFDRHGLFGRSPLVSLATVNAGLLGEGSRDWTRLAALLALAGLLPGDDVERIRLLWWFGRLIANTDMHAGNVSFRPQGTLALAPCYDMLPMLYAPLAGGEVPERAFEPPLALPAESGTWRLACGAALDFWDRAAGDVRISERFRGTCAANRDSLSGVAERI